MQNISIFEGAGAMNPLTNVRYKVFCGLFMAGCSVFSSCKLGVTGRRTLVRDSTTSAASDPAPVAKNCLHIVGGQETNQYPAVYLLLMIDPASGNVMSSCSGTFVSDNTLVTAAHCIPGPGVQYLLLATNGAQLPKIQKPPAGTVQAKQAFIDPAIPPAIQGGREFGPSQTPAIDFAVVIFPDNTASTWMPLATNVLPQATPVRLVGYGAINAIKPETDTANVVTKRTGLNSLAPLDVIRTQLDVEGQYFTFAWGEPDEVAAHGGNTVSGAPGDSGGPLLVNNVIIGVVSRGLTPNEVPDIQKTIGTNTLDVFVNVTNPTVKSLLEKAGAAGARINYASAAASQATQAGDTTPVPVTSDCQ